jgi:uncharacterized membrane protein YeaQ/YmgE (transglycosylase-associated protein family)
LPAWPAAAEQRWVVAPKPNAALQAALSVPNPAFKGYAYAALRFAQHQTCARAQLSVSRQSTGLIASTRGRRSRALTQLQNRAHTVLQLPNVPGRSRQGLPVPDDPSRPGLARPLGGEHHFPAARRGAAMNLSTESLAVILLVGILAGWLAGQLVRGTGFGLVGDLVIGVVGALIAALLFPRLGIRLGSGIVASIISATLGAVILLFVARLVRGRGRW